MPALTTLELPQGYHTLTTRRAKRTPSKPRPVPFKALPLVDRLAQLQLPKDFQSFGVEMEMLIPESTGYEGLEAAICQVAGNSTWEVKDDGSVDTLDESEDTYFPVEVATPVLKGTEGLLELVRVCQAIDRLNPRVNETCGLHVHVGYGPDGKSPWELSKLRRVVYNWLLHEPAMDLLVDPSRRASHNEYCLPLRLGYMDAKSLRSAIRNAFSVYRDLLESPGGCDGEVYYDDYYNHWDAILCDEFSDGRHNSQQHDPSLLQIKDTLQRCDRCDHLRFLVNPYGRRYKLNLHSVTRHNTIEFRHPAGSWDASEVAHYVLLYMRFLESSAMSVGKPYTVPLGTEQTDDPLQYLMDDIYGSDSLMDQELQLWIRHRGAQLAAPLREGKAKVLPWGPLPPGSVIAQ